MQARNSFDESIFDAVEVINAWLDSENDNKFSKSHDDSMRITKIAEELGEVARAYIGMIGQNPRKGVTHTEEEFLTELADVAITALCAMQHFTGNREVTAHLFRAKLARTLSRAGLDTLDRLSS